jgi:hypothetical protein
VMAMMPKGRQAHQVQKAPARHVSSAHGR